MGGCQSPSFSSPTSSPSPVLLHPCFAIPFLILVCPSRTSPRLNSAIRGLGSTVSFPRCLAKKMTSRSRRDQIQLVLMISKVGRDAFHGSHRVVVPMAGAVNLRGHRLHPHAVLRWSCTGCASSGICIMFVLSNELN